MSSLSSFEGACALMRKESGAKNYRATFGPKEIESKRELEPEHIQERVGAVLDTIDRKFDGCLGGKENHRTETVVMQKGGIHYCISQNGDSSLRARSKMPGVLVATPRLQIPTYIRDEEKEEIRLRHSTKPLEYIKSLTRGAAIAEIQKDVAKVYFRRDLLWFSYDLSRVVRTDGSKPASIQEELEYLGHENDSDAPKPIDVISAYEEAASELLSNDSTQYSTETRLEYTFGNHPYLHQYQTQQFDPCFLQANGSP